MPTLGGYTGPACLIISDWQTYGVAGLKQEPRGQGASAHGCFLHVRRGLMTQVKCAFEVLLMHGQGRMGRKKKEKK